MGFGNTLMEIANLSKPFLEGLSRRGIHILVECDY